MSASIWTPDADITLIQAVINAFTSQSTTNVTIGSGIKVFTAESLKLFNVGNWLTIVDNNNSANYMQGQITIYDPNTGELTVIVSATGFSGSGAHADWTITVSGMQGVSGTLSGSIAGNIEFLGNIDINGTLNVDSAVTFTNTVTLFADPVSALQAVTKQFLDRLIPIGVIFDYSLPSNTLAGLTTNWLPCLGQTPLRVTYPILHSLYAGQGYPYGVGDGVTTFGIPNCSRRVAVGSGGTATGTIGNIVSNLGGEENHTLNINEMPNHNHPSSTSSDSASVNNFTPGGSGGLFHLNGVPYSAIASQGGGAAHNNIQPSIIMTKILRVG